jgi:hypothetical protein
VLGKRYQLQRAGSLVDGWTAVQTQIIGTGENVTIQDTSFHGGTTPFYRIVSVE